MALELDELLLDAKLARPRPQPGSVSRAPLIATARTSTCRVVGLTAPAGYGKSTLLAEWAGSEDRPVGWVSLAHSDDDPAALLYLMASAYGRASGNTDVVAEMGGLGVSVLGRSAPRLAAALHASPAPFVLMLDDLHELQSRDCHDALSVLISGVPRGSQLVVASRSEQPHLARLRASGDALEFVASDLALDAAGAAHIFAQAHLDISPETAAAVTARTEGWPVGLYLAAVIARNADGDEPAISGDDRYVADYLYSESLTLLPESTQRFLHRTAVLDQLCAPLADALLGESGASEHLRHLEATSSFLVPLDRRREWFRYHALFREFLLAELRRVEPELIPKLHLRAADWYESNGSPATALEHLLNTSERERSVQLVTELILPTYSVGQMSTVQRWLSALGDASIEEYPPLAVLAGWVAALTGQTSETLRWAAIVDAASFDAVPLDGSASFDSGRAMFRAVMCAGGPEQMMTDARFAVDAEPPWSPWRDTALLLLAEALLLLGDVDHALPVFEETSSVAAQLGNTDTVVDSESELALFAMDRGEWADAVRHMEVALTTVEDNRMDDYPTSVLAFGAAARLALHRGDHQEAQRQLTRAMRARPSCSYVMPWLGVRVRVHLAKGFMALADQSTARHLLREIDDILLQCPGLGTLDDEVSRLRELVTSESPTRATGASPLSPAELRLLPYLQTHLTFREIGERLFVSRNTISSEVGSIYRKLGVSSRSDAVDQATAIGLLGA